MGKRIKPTDTNTKQIKYLDYLKNILRYPLKNSIANYLQIIKTNLCKETKVIKKKTENQIHHILKSMLDGLSIKVVIRTKKYNQPEARSMEFKQSE